MSSLKCIIKLTSVVLAIASVACIIVIFRDEIIRFFSVVKSDHCAKPAPNDEYADFADV